MKKLLLVGAVAVVAFAASSQARAGVSFSISLGHHYPQVPVVVAPPPVVVYPGHCAPAPVVVSPAPCAPVPVVVYPGHYAPVPRHVVYRHADRGYRQGYRQSGHGYAAGYGHQGSYADGNGGGLRVVANGRRH